MTFNPRRNKLMEIQAKRRAEKAEVARVWVRSGDHKATVDLLHAKRNEKRTDPNSLPF